MDSDEIRCCGSCGKPAPADGDMSQWRDCDECGGVFCSLDCWAADAWGHDLEDDERSAAGIET